MAAAALAFYVVADPLAPNWDRRGGPAADDRYILALRMKAVINGGDGEARQVFTRHAAASPPGRASGGYEVLTWQTASTAPALRAAGRLWRDPPPAAPRRCLPHP